MEVCPDWNIVRKIGDGGYSEGVFEVENPSQNLRAAMKISDRTQNLKMEFEVLSKLNKYFPDDRNFPQVIEYGSISEDKDYLVMTLHGTHIDELKTLKFDNTCEFSENFNSVYSDKDYFDLVMTMGQQCIKSLQKIHSLGYVHGDIKPANILNDSTEDELLFVLIDFGISLKYLDNDGMHKYKEFVPKFRGNIEFAAFECLQKFSPTRKHDMVSLVYTMLYLLKGGERLWGKERSTIDETSETVYNSLQDYIDSIIKLKAFTKFEEICGDFSSLEKFYNEIINLEYEEEPQYALMIDMLEELKSGQRMLKKEEQPQMLKINKTLKNLHLHPSRNRDGIDAAKDRKMHCTLLHIKLGSYSQFHKYEKSRPFHYLELSQLMPVAIPDESLEECSDEVFITCNSGYDSDEESIEDEPVAQIPF
ncbi:unnamed protein product [Moneuplotes crassus]|uniref:Casein kinase I n=1 Tax=Euplotes crassus TaxID=5936 RepID=A0AAD1UHT5_EUPCR|nr:unnamed protein product [Moneuplotes crassus]